MPTAGILSQLQELQRQFDERYWQHLPGQPTISHTMLHLTGVVGELAEYCAKREEGVEVSPEIIASKIIPELISHALRLANEPVVGLYNVELAMRDRWRSLAWDFGPPSDSKSPFWGNPPGCSCDFTHRSRETCPSKARSRGAIADPQAEEA